MIMKYILAVIFFYVTIIHFVCRAIKWEFSREYLHGQSTEADYYRWENKWFLLGYLFPYASFFLGGAFPIFVCCGLFIAIAFLRSIEHIHPRFLG